MKRFSLNYDAMKSILYYMHVDWHWIKQRPHFLAEGLSKYFHVDVIHEILYNSNKQKDKKPFMKNLSIKAMPHIPFCRYDFIFNINSYITNKILLRKKLRKADVIWLGNPIQYNFIKHRTGQILVYDCMDDLLGFSGAERTKRRFKRFEKKLCRDADVIFASSENLKQKLLERYGREDVYLLNNAISLSLSNNEALPAEVEAHFKSDLKKMVYIGTISDWFDFEAVVEALDEHKNVELLLFGPKDFNIPYHERIKHCGIIEHKHVHKIMDKADALVMPFVLNELIMSVDPVKAYEYIYACKPILMPRYPESEKFDKFVYLYSGKEEFKALVSKIETEELLLKGKEKDYQDYAMSNNWDERVKQICMLLK